MLGKVLQQQKSTVKTNAHNHLVKGLDLKNMIKIERMRADRDNHTFSLILFNISNSEKVNDLISIISRQIRSIDFVGMLGDNFLGILLPLINYEAANQLSQRLLDNETIKETAVFNVIYTYPDHWVNDLTISELKPGHLTPVAEEGEVKHKIAHNIKDFIVNAMVAEIPFWKRAFDLTVTSLCLLALSPLFIILAIYIKVVSPGPVFFKQKRVGYKGRHFDFYKFRTMHVNNNVSSHQNYVSNLINSDKPMEKLDHKRDPRIIRGAGLLRKASVDELPQLINVLKGDMSLVGPRPCLPYEEMEYLQWHKNRFNMLPGMTGLWQVSGKNKLSFKQMIRLDITYIKNLSIVQDVKILFLTIPTVFNLIFEKASGK